MKRILSLFISILILGLMVLPVYATSSEEYFKVTVEYSDNIGETEYLETMIKDGNLYVNAEKLAERLGYVFGSNEEYITIYNKDNNDMPISFTIFNYEDVKVSHMVAYQMVDSYEAPFVSVKNKKGSWIPFEYSLLLLNSSSLVLDDCVLIEMPRKNIIDYLVEIKNSTNKNTFEWNKDFGYSTTDINIIGASSHIVNLFNGILEFDGDSWATLFQSFAMNTSAYDKKYSEDLALLLCTQSDEEINAIIKEMNLIDSVFSEDGQLGKYVLKSYSNQLDSTVEVLYENCNNILESVDSSNSSIAKYNRSYQALENALNKQTWFSKTGGNIIEVQKGLSDVTNVIDTLSKVAEVVGYGKEFANHDEFSLASLESYLSSTQSSDERLSLMKESMNKYSSTLSENIATYSAKRYFDENIDEWIVDALSIEKALGTQANLVLFAWNIASNTVPFISNGLEAADNFELALYSQVFQSDTALNYEKEYNKLFGEKGNIDSENLYKLSQYCYLYLKSCYTTRNAALGTLDGKRESVKEQIKPLIEYQNGINKDIADMMIILKSANKTNEGGVYGFLPADNATYLSELDNSDLIEKIKSGGLSKPSIDEKYCKVIEKYINSASWEGPGIIQIDEEINVDCELYTMHNLDTVGYALQDIDNNGVDELLVGPTDNNGEVYTAFSLVDGDLVLLFMSWPRSRNYLLDNGKVLNNGSGGAFLSVWYNEAISDNKRGMVIQDGVITDGIYAESIGAKDPWFKATTSDTDDYVNISEQQARDTIDSWESAKVHIDYTPLSEYTNASESNPWKKLYIDYVDSMNEAYEDIYIAYIDDDNIPELYIQGKYHVAGAMLCWINNDKVDFRTCAQNFGYSEKSGKCYAYTMQMGVSLLTEYTLSDRNLTENKIASCSENNNTYTWNGIDVCKEDFWINHKKYIGGFTTPNYSDYIKRAEFATVIESY